MQINKTISYGKIKHLHTAKKYIALDDVPLLPSLSSFKIVISQPLHIN